MSKFFNNYSMETATSKTNPHYREILKLDQMLTEAEIPHTLEPMFDGWQICYPDKVNIVMDAIEHYGSYGNRADTLEIMGLLTPEEEVFDGFLGNLSAENVFERIRKHYAIKISSYDSFKLIPNKHINEILDDFKVLIEKAKSYGLDIKLTPSSDSSLVLYFHHDYPNTLLVDKSECGL